MINQLYSILKFYIKKKVKSLIFVKARFYSFYEIDYKTLKFCGRHIVHQFRPYQRSPHVDSTNESLYTWKNIVLIFNLDNKYLKRRKVFVLSIKP